MNVYITTGTLDYLENIKKEHPSEAIVMMTNENGALLFHETSSASVFNAPQTYEIVASNGEIKKGEIAVMDYIPITDEERPLFEQKFNDRVKSLGTQAGLAGIRLLRPSSTNTYVILTAWDNAKDFESWKQSNHYFMADAKEWHPQPDIFESAPYERIYKIID